MMKYFFRALFSSLFVLWLPFTGFGQADSIDMFIHHTMQQRSIPGLQLAIVKKGKIVKSENYGFANIQDSIKVQANTVFTISSIAKAFTAVAILQLAEADKLKLQDSLSTYLDSLPVSWQRVTIRHLLSHTSGIPNILNNENGILIVPDNEATSWQKVQTLPTAFEAGKSFSYSQTNYLLLGKIIDKVSGQRFTEFITQNQFLPVAMPHTLKAGYGDNYDIVPHEARGYTLTTAGKLINVFETFPPSLRTTAGMRSTAKEMAEWLIALQKRDLLKEAASLSILWEPVRLTNGKPAGFNRLLNGYALGFPIASRNEHPAVTAIGGGRAALFLYPHDSLTVIVLTNLKGSLPETFIDEIAGFYIPDMKEANGFGYSPDVKQLWKESEKSAYKKISEHTRRLKKNKTLTLPEDELNSWGYKLLHKARITEAIEIFKLNTTLYPLSANAYDSLAEAYVTKGDVGLAILNYKQSLKLDPQNENAIEQLNRLNTNR